MLVICETCCKPLGRKDGTGISHGICESCKLKRAAEILRLANLYAIHAVEDAMALPRRQP
jgi:hypothetical protein